MPIQKFSLVLPTHLHVQILAADITNLKQLFGAAGGSGLLFSQCLVTNTDGIDHKVDFWHTGAGINYLLGSIDVPAGTGKAGVPAIDAVPLIFGASGDGFFDDNTTVCSASVEVAVVTGAVQFVLVGGYF